MHDEQMIAYRRYLERYGCLRYIDTGTGGIAGFAPSSFAELGEVASRGDHFLLVADAARPGAPNTIVQIEYQLFPPGTALNYLLDLYHALWQEMLFHIVVVPKTWRSKVTRVVTRCGMRIADGIPMMISKDGHEFFPTGNHSTIFTMENREGSPVHGASPLSVIEMRREEAHQLEEFFARQRKHEDGYEQTD